MKLKPTDVIDDGRIVSDTLTILSPVRFQRGPTSGNEAIYTKRKHRGNRRDSRPLPEIRVWGHEVPQFQQLNGENVTSRLFILGKYLKIQLDLQDRNTSF